MPIENALKSSSWQKLSQGLDQKSWTPWESQKIWGRSLLQSLTTWKQTSWKSWKSKATHLWLPGVINHQIPPFIHWRWGPCFRNLAAKGYGLSVLTSHTWSVPDWLAHSPKEQSGALGRNTWEILALVQLTGKIHQNSAILQSSHFRWITFSISGDAHLKQFKCGLNMILHPTVLQVSYAYTHKPRMNYGEKKPSVKPIRIK